MKIVLRGRSSQAISIIVAELRSMGYETGRDFDFEFATGRYDYNMLVNIDPQTTFTFHTPALATWFRLRYLN